jgi:hypothetical protein
MENDDADDEEGRLYETYDCFEGERTGDGEDGGFGIEE